LAMMTATLVSLVLVATQLCEEEGQDPPHLRPEI
jgi:hypothetical protein